MMEETINNLVENTLKKDNAKEIIVDRISWYEMKLLQKDEEIEELKRQIKIKDEYFHLIWMIGCDYDGYETPRGLKSIIDELVEYANYGAKNDDKYVKDLLELREDEN